MTLSVLGRLASEAPKVKFLTGRPEPCINEGLRLLLLGKMTDVFVLHHVEPAQIDGDIRGHWVKNDWWILGLDRKRLLMLPTL